MIQFPSSLTTPDYTLRPLTAAHVDALYALTNDPLVTTTLSFLSYPVPPTAMTDWIAQNQGVRNRVYGIFFGDCLVGQFGVHADELATAVEIGYWIGKAFQGRGAATQAVHAMIPVLRALNPNVGIAAECLPDNLPSRHILEKAGFAVTGRPGHRPGRILLVYRGR